MEEDFDFEATAIRQVDVERWKRPAIDLDSLEDALPALEIELVDIKTHYVSPWTVPAPGIIRTNGSSQLPCISVYGVDAEGRSVCVNVWNYHPYFYLSAPPRMEEGDADAYCKAIDAALERHLDAQRKYPRSQWLAEREQMAAAAVESLEREEYSEGGQWSANKKKRSRRQHEDDDEEVEEEEDRRHWSQQRGPRRTDPGTCVVSVEHVYRTSAIDCKQEKASFFRVTLRTPNMISKARDFAMAAPIMVPGLAALPTMTFESNVVFENRFMVDRGIVGNGWISVRADSYLVRVDAADRRSQCQVEVDVDVSAILGIDMDCVENAVFYDRSSQMRAISYDIECMGRPGLFPDSQEDPIIQIAAVGWRVGDLQEAREECRVLFTLNSCLSISGTRVVCARTERELINNFATFLHYYDPDVILGYNTKGFDDAYVYDRATILNCERYLMSGRDKQTPLRKIEDNRMSRNFGNRQGYNVEMIGRTGFDMLPFVTENKKLRSYTLNAVSADILGDQKEDLHHSMISVLQKGTAADRQRLGLYCVKDVLLPKMLATKMLALQNLCEFARATGVQMRQIQDQGQSVKIFMAVLRLMYSLDILMPYMPGQEKRDYQGANVFVPRHGFYTFPVAVLDFSSLYPSLMMAGNVCFTTYVPPERRAEFDPRDLKVCPNGHAYVRAEKRVGVLTRVLERFLDRRSECKRLMEEAALAGDRSRSGVYNMRQLAFKVCANSVYGWTGLSTSVYFWYCADSTTAYGRKQIIDTQRMIESYFTRANGFPFDARVIYGDTDSVMVLMELPIEGDMLEPAPDGSDKKIPSAATRESIALAIKYAHEMAVYCTARFEKPNALQFENIYWPYLLLDRKKRYAGPFWENAEKPSYTKVRGLESVRRDNSIAAMDVQKKCLDYILGELNPEKAYDYVCALLKRLRMGDVDMSQLVTSKRLNARQCNLRPEEKRAVKRRVLSRLIQEQGWKPRQVLSKQRDAILRKAQSRELKRMCEERGIYSTKQPHAELDKVMRERTGMGYNINERVPYVIANRGRRKQDKVYEKAEDPIYALEHDLELDLEYYSEEIITCAVNVLAPVYEKQYTHQSIGPLFAGGSGGDDRRGSDPTPDPFNAVTLATLTKYKLGDRTKERLRHGPHMVKIRRHYDISPEDHEKSRGTLFASLVRIPKCVGCKAPIRTTGSPPALCGPCRADEEGAFEIYMRELAAYRHVEIEYNRLWTQCQNCQGSFHRKVDCSAISCPIFFRRTVVERQYERRRRVIEWDGW